MPYTKINASFVVPAEQAGTAHESLDKAIDQLSIQHLDVADSEVTEECADPPDETD